ncbi:carboxypeptidase-like regulatory domain-containing protein [Pseudacidobacterium ailaaui]|uniref:carboxypeptidase-like regulatory domain-containing protein n=1 Tax=Pseudacidobacterium ailaaui TaxID=1382359 RepID=UPI000678D0D1|nr:carboxypeptidase-like regulatory domain-containing protein [Pseudacidobacterium ailaaui]
MRRLLPICVLLVCWSCCLAQTQGPPASAAASGGTVHGSVKSGTVPLPGVSVTATNTLTGKKYSTVTDITGSYSLAIPQNGRYVVRTDFAAFASETKEVIFNAASAHDQQADFALTLASRAQQQEGTSLAAQSLRNLGGAQNLGLLNAASGLIQAGNSNASSDTSLPSLANNSDFSNESVAVSGQSGSTNPFAGINMGQMRENMENMQFDQSLSQVPGSSSGGRGGPGGFGGPGGLVVALS